MNSPNPDDSIGLGGQPPLSDPDVEPPGYDQPPVVEPPGGDE